MRHQVWMYSLSEHFLFGSSAETSYTKKVSITHLECQRILPWNPMYELGTNASAAMH
jgi:hypothetical protein